MKCKDCKNKQYCRDCKEEQAKTKAQKITSKKSPTNDPITIKGDLLHFKGRTFTISKTEVRNPNKKITTKEGFIFYIREKNQVNILIKVKINKPQKGKPDFCEKCYDLLIGETLPKQLIQDTNW